MTFFVNNSLHNDSIALLTMLKKHLNHILQNLYITRSKILIKYYLIELDSFELQIVHPRLIYIPLLDRFTNQFLNFLSEKVKIKLFGVIWEYTVIVLI